MTDITPYDAIPLDVATGPPARPRLLLIATGLVSGAILVGYFSLIGHYISERQTMLQGSEPGTRWLPDGVNIPLTQPNFMLLTVSMSLISMLWAVSSIKHDDRPNAYMALGLTIVFGFAQIVQTAFLLSLMEMAASDGEPAALIYTLVGLQLLIMGLAMAYAAGMAVRSLGGAYSAKDYEGIVSAAIFWFMSAGVFVTLWYAVYITK